MITKIGDILREIIPEFENIEIIYGEHYTYHGHAEKTHMLLIRNCLICYEGGPVDFKLDCLNVQRALEKELPLKVEFDKTLMFDDGLTYKFYITLTGDD